MDWGYFSGVIWVVTANKGFCRMTNKENPCDLKGSSSKNAHELQWEVPEEEDFQLCRLKPDSVFPRFTRTLDIQVSTNIIFLHQLEFADQIAEGARDFKCSTCVE
jgi:hypothetical protein